MQMRETDKELILLSAVCRLYQIPNYLLIPFNALRLHYIKTFFQFLLAVLDEFK